MNAPTKSLNQVRYLSGSGQTTTSYAITLPASGQYSGLAALTTLNANLFFFSMGELGDASGGDRYRGLRILPFGTGANNDTFSFRVYAVHFLGGEGNGQQGPIELKLLATNACTFGNATGIIGGMFSTSERIVDTAVMTKSAYLTALESAMTLSTGAGAYSPADDTQAAIWIPECGNAAGIVIDSVMTGSNAGNYLIQRDI